MRRSIFNPAIIACIGFLLCSGGRASDDVFDSVHHGRVDSDGVSIHYVTMGEGPLILMLHGFPDFWYTWRRLMPELARHNQVVAIDLRGYNQSDKPQGVENYTMAKLIGDVVATIGHFGNSKVILVGHDWGGAIAWQVAMRRPELIEKLIILSTPHPVGLRRELTNNTKQKENSQYARDFQSDDSAQGLTPDILAGWVTDPAAKTRYLAAFEQSDVQSMMNYYKASYPNPGRPANTAAVAPPANPLLVQSPTLVIFGLEDQALLPSGFNGTWDQVEAELTMVAIPGAAHFVHHDAPDAVLKTIRGWLCTHQAGCEFRQ